ncbi:hypothetical protein M885DRAFT_565260 [Pelagophyceae sp. CCMP2097]|nr:hypothetical protein M885DRAFT_565260 [Pelagophyceae sp. CCMP2097]
MWALLLALLAGSRRAGALVISSGPVVAEIDDATWALVSLTDGRVPAVGLTVLRDGWRIEATSKSSRNITRNECGAAFNATSNATVAAAAFDCQGVVVTVIYEAFDSFVSKMLRVAGARSIQSVTPWAGLEVDGIVVRTHANPHFSGGAIAAFGRADSSRSHASYALLSSLSAADAESHGFFVSVANPFFTVTQNGAATALAYDAGVDLGYAAGVDLSDDGFAYDAEPGVLGATRLQGYAYGDVNLGERRAFLDCVESFLMDGPARLNKTVKVNVAWDESDYQIDVGTPEGVAEYAQIIAANARLGISHVVYEPQNSRHASRFNSTDGWGWEASLWFSMGERIREHQWDPRSDAVPDDILKAVSAAAAQNVSLLAYVYPCLAFEAWPEHVLGGALDISPPEVRHWLFDTLHSFLRKTGASGFAWDHGIFAGDETKRYSQWRSWMSILKRLRLAKPDIVMDHRQTSHAWGPWYQLAGSYAEPLAGDENPETYGVPVPSLHTDHVAADKMRIVNHVYARQQLLPPQRMPGFVFHQTERTDDNGTNACFGSEKLCYDFHTRDTDLVGSKYSVLSSIGTAGLNNVFAMIPARDADEASQLPAAFYDFVSSWLKWTDAHLACLAKMQPIATLPAPAFGTVDGFACFDADEGFAFLFNPALRGRGAELRLDESLGLANSTTDDVYEVVELYPSETHAYVSTWRRGASETVQVGGSDARVLQLTKTIPKGAVFALANVARKTARFSVAVDAAPREVTVDGVAQSVDVFVEYANDAVYRSMPLAPAAVAPDDFQQGWLNVSGVCVPVAVKAQLAARAAAYPIPWRPEEYKAAWLVPTRLLLAVSLRRPAEDMLLKLYVNGIEKQLARAYNSRGLQRPKCFLGFYYDASALPDESFDVALRVDSPLQQGEFEGLFWENVETPPDAPPPPANCSF